MGAFLFGLVILFGQLIFALGAFMDNKLVMYAGRFVFGLVVLLIYTREVLCE